METVNDIIQRVSLAAHIRFKRFVGNRLGAVVNEEDRADVRVDGETCERSEQHINIIGSLAFAAFRVGYGNNTVYVRKCIGVTNPSH